jgi:hypothetical protein
LTGRRETKAFPADTRFAHALGSCFYWMDMGTVSLARSLGCFRGNSFSSLSEGRVSFPNPAFSVFTFEKL